MQRNPTLEELAREALSGDRTALDRLVHRLQADVYGLALRMLWHREDAEDATQEILVRVVTRLSQFDFRSQLKTWVYRVAVNYLLDVKKSPIERQRLSFAEFADDLSAGLSDRGPADGERSVLTEEVKVGCTLAMLQCLDRPHRLAYLLGEVFQLDAPEAALALNIEPAAFRKRLERSREAIEAFTRRHCGLVSEAAACQCNRRVAKALQIGRIHPDRPNFADQATAFVEARNLIRSVEATRRTLELQRTNAPQTCPADLARRIATALHLGTN